MKNEPEWIEMIPNYPPEDYTMRAEWIRAVLKAVLALGLISAIGSALIWGLP